MDYREAGVDISAADAAKARIKRLASGTFNAGVLSEIGSFGGLFRPDLAALPRAGARGLHGRRGHEDPGRHRGGRPRHRGLRPRGPLRRRHPGPGRRAPLLPRLHRPREDGPGAGRGRSSRGFAARLRRVRLPAHRRRDRRDARHLRRGRLRPRGLHRGRRGASQGAARRGVREGDVLLGLPSSGLHTNGYTLARKVLFDTLGHARRHPTCPSSARTVGAALLAPHRSYLAALEPLLERDKIRALAHITGGGFPGNIPRVLPDGPGRAGAPRRLGGAAPLPADPAGRRRRRRRDVPHLQHGRRAWSWSSRPRTSTTSSTRSSGGARRASSSARWWRARRRLRVVSDGTSARLSASDDRAGSMTRRSASSSAAAASQPPGASSTRRSATGSAWAARSRSWSRTSRTRPASSAPARAGIPAAFRDHRGRTREDLRPRGRRLLRGARRRPRLPRGLHAPPLPRVHPRLPGPRS